MSPVSESSLIPGVWVWGEPHRGGKHTTWTKSYVRWKHPEIFTRFGSDHLQTFVLFKFSFKNVFDYSWYLWRTVRKRDPWSCHLRGNGWEGMKRGTAVGWVWSFLHVSEKTAQCLCNIYYSRDRKNKHQAKVRILRLQRQTLAFLMICR